MFLNTKRDLGAMTRSKRKSSDSDKWCPCGNHSTEKRNVQPSLDIECEKCKTWWHVSCAGLTGLSEDGIKDIQQWKCALCIIKYLKLDNNTSIETAVKNEVKKVVPAIVKAVVEETIKEKNFSKTFSDVVKAGQDEFNVKASRTIQNSMDSAIMKNQEKIVEKATLKQDADNMEREKRKRNVVISGVPESSQLSSTARNNSDTKEILNIFQPDDSGIVVSCYRAGKNDGDRPRLLVVTISTPEKAQVLHGFGSGRKFISGNGKDTVWCNPDLIRADRIANYSARKLQRDRRNQLADKRRITKSTNPIQTEEKMAIKQNKSQASATTTEENIKTEEKKVKNEKREKVKTTVVESDTDSLFSEADKTADEGEYASDATNF